MTGRVFNIQRFSLHDGPGIRTTAFLMGCNLNCRWCHNPEGKCAEPGLQYDGKSCIGCGACGKACPTGAHTFGDAHRIDFAKCRLCGGCIGVCPAEALSISGTEYTPEDLSRLLCRDIPFFQETGGVTFSGGEPLLQAEFVAQTARLCKLGGVPTVGIDTAGLLQWESFEKVLPFADFFLFDIKAAREEVHIQGTGVSNGKILENLRRLDRQGKDIYIRVPVIPGINDAPEEMEKIAAIVQELQSVKEFRLLPYHTFGREKYRALGLDDPELFRVPGEEEMENLRRITGAC